MIHVHWHVRVRGDSVNGYYECRCGSRIIRQRDRGRPMDYSWLASGVFVGEPLSGEHRPLGGGRCVCGLPVHTPGSR